MARARGEGQRAGTITVTVMVLMTLVSFACGTRQDNAERASGTGKPATPAGDTAVAAGETTSDGAPGAGSSPSADQGSKAGVPPAPVAQGAAAASVAPGSAPSAGGRASASQEASGSNRSPRAVAAAESPAAGSSAAPGAPGGPGNAAPVPAPVNGRPSPVVVGHVGSLSGPAGTVLIPVMQGVQLWVQAVNEKGGVNGHQVKLVVYDDGGDPARHRAQVQDAVERQRAIAFIGNTEPITGRPSVDYINAKRVPVVGDAGGVSWALESPMYFTQHAQAEAFFFSTLSVAAEANVPAGRTKLGTVICVEAPDCDGFDRTFKRHAKALGMELVYAGRTSLAQPDFTAECLAARNAGVQVFLVVLDKLSVSRVANACARQGYRPALSHIGFTAQSEDQKRDSNLEGMSTPSDVFPYFQSGTPATDEFQRALRSHGKGMILGVGIASGWTTGKMFERAAANLPEPATSEAVLQGLWSFNNENLGGLTMPLTFVKDQPLGPPTVSCYWPLLIQKGAWTSPNAFAGRCVDIPR